MRCHAFLSSDGKMRDLGCFTEGAFRIPGIPDSREFRPAGSEFSGHAYGINTSGRIVGTINSRAFLYSHGRMIDLNGRVNLAHSGFKILYSAKAINDAGQIVGEGGTDTPYVHTHAFLLTPITAGK